MWKWVSRKAIRRNSAKDWTADFSQIEPENARRLRYDGKNWSEDVIKIKMEAEPFGRGKHG